MAQVFVVGDEPVAGCRLLEHISGTAFYRLWKVRAPDGSTKMWKEIDLVVGNVAVETRLLTLLVKLRHRYLSTLTNFWHLNDGRTLVIETDFPEMSLRQRLDQCRKEASAGVPTNELLQYVETAAEGLDFLNRPQHAFEGQQVAVYHRALRPDCLLLFREPQGLVCKVADFGLAKPVSDAEAAHSQGLMNYDYDPPEFFEGQTSATSDQYALAINYYELRTGLLPFPGTMLEQLQSRLNDRPDLQHLGEPERSILRKALTRDPAQRYSSATDLVQQLKSGVAQAGASAAQPAVAAVRRSAAAVEPAAAAHRSGAPALAAASMSPAAGLGATHPQTPASAAWPERVASAQPPVVDVAGQAAPAAQPTTGSQARADLAQIREQLKAGRRAQPAAEPEQRELLIPMTWVVLVLGLAVVLVLAGAIFFR